MTRTLPASLTLRKLEGRGGDPSAAWALQELPGLVLSAPARGAWEVWLDTVSGPARAVWGAELLREVARCRVWWQPGNPIPGELVAAQVRQTLLVRGLLYGQVFPSRAAALESLVRCRELVLATPVPL